jgi:hypothetical protein
MVSDDFSLSGGLAKWPDLAKSPKSTWSKTKGVPVLLQAIISLEKW